MIQVHYSKKVHATISNSSQSQQQFYSLHIENTITFIAIYKSTVQYGMVKKKRREEDTFWQTKAMAKLFTSMVKGLHHS